MTSQINYTNINANFPVPGVDNDTQTFRDNFDSIKTNFRHAEEEITALQSNTAKLNTSNDYQWNLVSRVINQNNIEHVKDYGNAITASGDIAQEIDFENGSYQIIKLASDISINFRGFPGDPDNIDTAKIGVGRMTVELYSDGTTSRTVTIATSGGTTIKKSSNFPGTLTTDSSSNPTIIEVWRRSQGIIFVNYLGKFS